MGHHVTDINLILAVSRLLSKVYSRTRFIPLLLGSSERNNCDVQQSNSAIMRAMAVQDNRLYSSCILPVP